MLTWLNGPSRKELVDEVERLRRLEQFYGPVAQLDQRIDQLRDEAIKLCDLYEEKSAALEAYGPVERLHIAEEKLKNSIAKLSTDYAAKKELFDRLSELTGRLEELDGWQNLGIYEPKFTLETSADYKQAIEENASRQKAMIRDKSAAVCHIEWTVDGSVRKGRTMTKEGIKMALRAFNNECEAIIGRVTWRNFDASDKRIDRAFDQINKLMASNQIEISSDYLDLKLEQLSLVHEQAQKIKEEKEEARRVRELEREEVRAQREFDEAIRQSEEEEERYEQALQQAREELGTHDSQKLREQIADLEAKLERTLAERKRAESMAQHTSSGHVYVISNIGSFGKKVFKVGMTRRIEPMDRVRELGDASVPFSFDVHAMIWNDDAPALERKLHEKLHGYRVNRVNFRKEFFMTDMSVVRDAILTCAPNASFLETADAEQYHQSAKLHSAENGVELPAAL
jgi:hypothetical protein